MKQGFDILIIATQNSSQEEFWQKRLRSLSGEICKRDAYILAISGNWKGEAGTGLGALYAYTKAQEKSKFKYHQDLLRMHRNGASVALYDAAGIHKKLFPLLTAKNPSIASLKLPSRQLSLLEIVVKHTNQYFSKNQEKRLSVFPCDQIFYPSKTFESPTDSPITLYCQMRPSNFPGTQLIALEQSGAKVFKTAEPIILETRAPIACNLSAFSLSLDLTQALTEEFQQELENETGKLDADAHFWMPLTLDHQTFLSLNPTPENQLHFYRMAAFKERFIRQHSPSRFLRAKDIGENGYWWNFNTVRSYYETLLKLREASAEGHQMRQLFGIKSLIDSKYLNRVISDQRSCLIDSKILGGSIKNSVLIGVEADHLEVENCVLIDCRLSSLTAQNALLYTRASAARKSR